jgi:hypothetical protein
MKPDDERLLAIRTAVWDGRSFAFAMRGASLSDASDRFLLAVADEADDWAAKVEAAVGAVAPESCPREVVRARETAAALRQLAAECRAREWSPLIVPRPTSKYQDELTGEWRELYDGPPDLVAADTPLARLVDRERAARSPFGV